MCDESAMSEEQDGQRLQKVLAHAGVASRRICEQYIRAGRVSVNGALVTRLGTRVRPGIDRIEVDGLPVHSAQKHLYYLLYKPVGYLSTVRDPHSRRPARTLVPSEERLYPVGRLDLKSEGLLLFTNDGALAHRLTHPRFGHEKEYLVLVRGQLDDDQVAQLRRGVSLEGETSSARAFVSRQGPRWRWRGEIRPRGCHWVSLVVKEGRKRLVRRMLETTGHRVERLVRVRMGDLTLGDLEPGAGRWLDRLQAQRLRRSVGL